MKLLIKAVCKTAGESLMLIGVYVVSMRQFNSRRDAVCLDGLANSRSWCKKSRLSRNQSRGWQVPVPFFPSEA